MKRSSTRASGRTASREESDSGRGHAPGEKLSAVDTAWLRMDRPGNLMMICGVLLFRRRVSRARLLRVLDERFLRFARFRQRPV